MKNLLLLLFFIFFGCSGRKHIIIDESFDRDTVFATANSSIRVILPSNPSTGYQWFLETAENSYLSLDSSLFRPGTECLLGSPGEQIFFITFSRDDSAVLVFYYSREWESSPPADSFTVFIFPGKYR